MHEPKMRDSARKLIAIHSVQRTPTNEVRLRLRQSWLAWRRVIASPIYRIYEQHLLRQVLALPVPRHIGLILDGNRRYGRHHNLSDPHDIYMAGANKLDELLDWCTELQVQSMTLWVCSTENLKRPLEQVAGILSAVE